MLLAGVLAASMGACADGPPVAPAAGSARVLNAWAVRGGVSVAAAPSNDDRASAFVIATVPGGHVVNTAEATPAADDPTDCAGGPTVWYVFTAPSTDRFVVNLFGTDYDTVLGVYRSDAGGGLTLIGCNDNSAGRLFSVVGFDAVAGQTYYFVVGAADGATGGNLELGLTFGMRVSVGIDEVGSIDKKGRTATIRGTLACSEPSTARIAGVLRDWHGRVTVAVPFSTPTSVRCDAFDVWAVTVALPAAFRGAGPVEVIATGTFMDVETLDVVADEATAPVKLKQEKKER
jgi:hypothetical protein